MSLYNLFATDKSAEKDGIWIDYGEAGQIKIARTGGANQAYQSALQKFYKENKHSIDRDTLSDEVAEKKQTEIFARHVVLDWEDIKDEHGDDMEYSYENVVKLLTDLPDLYADLRGQASKVSNFRAAALEEDVKN